MKRVWLFLYFMPAPLLCQVLIQGQALNGSQDSSAVSGLHIVLQRMTPETGVAEKTADLLSGRDGRFQGTVPQPDSTAHYFVTSEYQGARYFSELMTVDRLSRRISTRIVIFDSCRSASRLITLMHHVIVEDNGTALLVREMRALSNPLNRTILAAVQDEHESAATLMLQLPPTARRFTPQNADPDAFALHGHTVYFKGVLEPGNHQLHFTYELPWRDGRAELIVIAATATRSLDFFVADAGQLASTSRLKDHGPFTIRDRTFARYGARDVSAGQALQINFQRSNQPDPGEHPYYALGLTGGLLLVALTVYELKKRNPVP
ncbi:hypothetical protein GX408_05765 [bacterium]|nr:hypothetical protein [bacterium]